MMHTFDKKLKRQKENKHGRIELKRKKRTFLGLFIRVLLAILVFVAISLFFIIYYNIPYDLVSTAALFIFGIWFVPSFLPVMFEEMRKIRNDPDRRMHRDMQIKSREEARRTAQATNAAANAPSEIDSQAILGGAYAGTLPWYTGPYATLPAQELGKHGILIGGSGSGKTVSLLRIAYIAAKIYNYRVFFVDAKGDKDTAAQFIALMRSLDYNTCMFPKQPIAGWRGDGNAIFNRLMALEEFHEPYYKATAKRVLNAICKPKPPASSKEFLRRLDLLDIASLPGISDRDLGGVQNRYHAFFDTVEAQLDGSWSFETADAGYILLDGTSLKEEATSLGRFLIEDFSHYATSRKKRGTRDLLIIDEYSALSRGTDAANLIERLRSYGCAVILSSQSYAGLGKQEDAERILDAANFLMIHRNAAPEKLTRRAGMAETEHDIYNLSQDVKTHGTTRTSIEEEDAIHPDEARRLKTGEALLIAHGCYMRAMIAQPPAPDTDIIDEIRIWISQRPIPPLEPLQLKIQQPTPLLKPLIHVEEDDQDNQGPIDTGQEEPKLLLLEIDDEQEQTDEGPELL